jgi:DNA-binding transcriptional LysR family regulator
MSLRALVDHDLICLPRGSGIRASLDEGCATARLQCRVALEASNPELVADLAALGLGVAVLPESYARTRDDLHLLRLGRPTLHAYVGVAWRAHGRLPVAATALVTLWQNRHSASSGGPA